MDSYNNFYSLPCHLKLKRCKIKYCGYKPIFIIDVIVTIFSNTTASLLIPKAVKIVVVVVVVVTILSSIILTFSS